METKQKNQFIKFLKENYRDYNKSILHDFENYFKILVETNKKINLFSRKMPIEDIWTKHFLDSILPIKEIKELSGNVLDFGTGGGLPGIPLKILFPEIKITFLDSRTKKINAIKEFCNYLNLKDCYFIDKRIENKNTSQYFGKFDNIVSRAVRITSEYKTILFNLLKKRGKIILYKSINIDDAALFIKKKIYNYKIKEIGTRNIVEIER